MFRQTFLVESVAAGPDRQTRLGVVVVDADGTFKICRDGGHGCKQAARVAPADATQARDPREYEIFPVSVVRFADDCEFFVTTCVKNELQWTRVCLKCWRYCTKSNTRAVKLE